MSFAWRLRQFFIEILKLLSLFWWYICFALMFLFGAGVFLFALSYLEDVQDSSVSLLYKDNPHYGRTTSYTPTRTVSHDVYDNSGYKVGSIKTEYKGKTEYSTDNDKIVPRYFFLALYMFYYPLNRIFAVVLSFFALFTKRFYVVSKCNDSCNKALYTFFNVVV